MVGRQPVSAHELRSRAIRRIRAKHDFRFHLFAYLAVNEMLVVIWAVTGGWVTSAGLITSFFWPIFPIVGWGVGIGFHWYAVYYVRPFSESDIQREVERLRG